MPIVPPVLDDRGFDDLVEEALRRIPAHTPEWTNPRTGDPGRTLLELFAWLTDTLLYRANQIPERQRLVFLRLLGERLRPAVAARGIVTLAIDDPAVSRAVKLRAQATLRAPVPVETRSEVTVLPVTGEAYVKRPLTEDEQPRMAELVVGLRELYQISGNATPYVTTPLFPEGEADPGGFDLITRTVDRCLWVALLAPAPEARDAVRDTLGASDAGGQQVIDVGVAPSIEVPALFEEIGPRPRVPHVWEISGVAPDGAPDYHALDLVSDTSAGLTRRGVVRLALPGRSSIGAPSNDVRTAIDAGVGPRPPRLDDPDRAARLVAWIRLRPTVALHALSLSWVGINAVEVDARQTVRGRIIGTGSGAPDQEMRLPGGSIEAESLELQVEARDRGYVRWTRLDDLGIAGRDDEVYELDAEAGIVRFGDGMRGRVPEAGARVRVATARFGGGTAGNLPAGSLTDIRGTNLAGAPENAKLKVHQSLPLGGGEDAETLAEAERRIPARLRNRDRAVTASDYRQLAAEAPGVRLGRVEVLPRFKPQQRRDGVPGVVSVMILPEKEGTTAPAPRPDRPMLEAVHAHLEPRRPLATELYVIGCEYIPIGVAAGVAVRDGFGRDGVMHAVREALRTYLWPLVPGGPDAAGWPLGRAVRDRELEVEIARVEGVAGVNGVNLFARSGDTWRIVPRPDACAPVRIDLRPWQLPELLSVVVVPDGEAPTDLRGLPNPFAGDDVAVPVVPELC